MENEQKTEIKQTNTASSSVKKDKLSIPGFIIAIAAIGVIFLFVFLCNRAIYFQMDDTWYWTNLVKGNPINSVNDIVESQIWHYLNWGGRSVAHTLLQFLLWSGTLCCDILNTIVFALLAFFLTRFSEKKDKWTFLFAVALLIACNPTIRDTLFWQSGCTNYLYMSIIYIPFAWMYLHKVSSEKINLSKDSSNTASDINEKNNLNILIEILMSVIMLIWGTLSGWTNENIGPAIFLLSVAIIVLMIKNKKTPSVWMITGASGAAIGSALILLAPGNRVREVQVPDYGNWKLNLCHRFIDTFKPAYEWLFPMFLIVIFSLMLYVLVIKHMPDLTTILILSTGLIAYAGLILSPHIPERSMFGIMCFLIWGTLRILGKVFDETKKNAFKIILCLFVSFVAFMKLLYLWSITVGWYL